MTVIIHDHNKCYYHPGFQQKRTKKSLDDKVWNNHANVDKKEKDTPPEGNKNFKYFVKVAS